MIFVSQNRGVQNKATPIVYNAHSDSKGQEQKRQKKVMPQINVILLGRGEEKRVSKLAATSFFRGVFAFF